MFETAVLSSGPQTKRVWSTFLGFGGQAVLLGCLVVAPMVWPQALPRVAWAISLTPPSAPPAPPAPQGPQIVPRTRVIPVRTYNEVFTAPRAVPRRVIEIDDSETPVVAQDYVPGAVAGSG